MEARRRRARRLLRTGCRHARHLQELHRRRATEERELASHGAARRAARPHYTAERCEMMASLGAVAVDDELHLVAVPREVDEDERHSVLPPCCQASLHDGGGGRALTGCQNAVGCDEHRDGFIVGGRTFAALCGSQLAQHDGDLRTTLHERARSRQAELPPGFRARNTCRLQVAGTRNSRKQVRTHKNRHGVTTAPSVHIPLRP